MNFRIRGKAYKDRLGFSLTDPKYNAKQFEVIALGAAVKAVIEKAQKSKVTPHVLLDRLANLYLQRQQEADKEAEVAVAENGAVETKLNDSALSMGRSIDQDNRHRREQQEADRLHQIALRERAHHDTDQLHREQLELLLAETGKWSQLSGKAVDIGASSNGSVWVAGTNGSPYGWDGKKWQKVPVSKSIFVKKKGKKRKVQIELVRLDVGPDGKPWAISKYKNIFSWTGGKWVQIPGHARDIGVGADGTVWVIGKAKAKGGYQIFRRAGSTWKRVHGGAIRIDVDQDGNAWVVNKNNRIYRYDGKSDKWSRLPGRALDIAVSPTGIVMVIGKDRAPWVWDGQDWHRLSGRNLAALTLDRNGLPLGVTTSKQIWAMGKANPPPRARMENLSRNNIRALLKKRQRNRRVLMRHIMHHAEKAKIQRMHGRQ